MIRTGVEQDSIGEERLQKLEHILDNNFLSFFFLQIFIIGIEMTMRDILNAYRSLVAVVVNQHSTDRFLARWKRSDRRRFGGEIDLPAREFALQRRNEIITDHIFG